MLNSFIVIHKYLTLINILFSSMPLVNAPKPISFTVAIWSLRSVPISLLVLMFIFNSGSITSPHANLHFWFDALSIVGIVGIIAYWHQLQRLRWNVSLTIYLYVFLIFLLRNPYGVLTDIYLGNFAAIDWKSLLHSAEIWLGIFAIGMSIEVLIFHFRQHKQWAWWLALIVSIMYVASIVMFFSGTLGIWSLLDSETKQVFRQATRQRQEAAATKLG